MTTCVSDGTFSHLGSNDVKDFLEGRDDVKAQFMKHCIKKSITKSKQDPSSSTSTSAMSPDASFGTMPQPRIDNPSTIPTQSEIHETDMSRYDQPTPVQLLRNTANTSTIEITPSTSFSGTMGKRVPKMPTRFTIDLKNNLSEKNNPGLKRSKTGQVQQTITSSFGIRDARAVSSQNPCVSGAEKRVFTEIRDQEHNEQSAKKLKVSHEIFGLSSNVENVHSSVVGSESRLEDLSQISMKQEVDDTDEAAYTTSGAGDKTSTGNLSMTVFVEDMPSGSKIDTKTVPQVTSPILTGLRKKRKTSKFLQLDAIDCASEQELNAAIGEDDDGDQTKEAEERTLTQDPPHCFPVTLEVSARRTFTTQTFAVKMEALREVQRGEMRKIDIANRYNINLTTLSRWIKSADQIEKKFQTQKTARKLRHGKCPQVESKLLEWIFQSRETGEPISNQIVIDKARQIASEMNLSDFTGSGSWLHRFKHRHGICFNYNRETSMAIEDRNNQRNCTEKHPKQAEHPASKSVLTLDKSNNSQKRITVKEEPFGQYEC